MATIIRNKLTIIPNAYSQQDYEKQINDVVEFCSGLEDDKKKHMCFTKISPTPTTLENETKEKDDWLLNNWGTRFKALNACWITDCEMIFDTFWNPAIPIFIKIAKKFPNIRFNFKFASKRIGLKTGDINAANGKIIYFKKHNNYSKEAYETAFNLMPHLVMEYTYNSKMGTYEYDTTDFRARLEQDGFYKDSDGSVLIACDDKRKPLFDEVDDLPF